MNVQPMSGPRTLISRSAGALTLPGADRPLLRTFVPSIPTGGLCVPTVDFIRMLMGREMSEGAVADIASELQDVCRREQAPPIHTQVIITEELGCIHTVSTEFIVANIEGLGLPHVDTLAEGLGILLDEMADDKLGPDGMGGDVAAFESLTRLHRCAGKPRGRAPGHWHHLRGKALAEAATKKRRKGVWKTEDGEWRASHEVALDYAHWLFPAFHIWTIRLLLDDPICRWRINGMFESLFGVMTAPIMPAAPAPEPHLRLVHDADQGGEA